MSGDPLPCPQCPSIATSLYGYMEHIKKDHGMHRGLCPKCPKDMHPKTCYSRTLLYNHVKKEHAEQGFVVCNECQDPILKDKLIEHLKFHAKTFGHFFCPFPRCQYSFHGRTVKDRYRAIYLQHKLEVHHNRSVPSVHLVKSDKGKVWMTWILDCLLGKSFKTQ
jgi:hypothetical protein